MLVTGGGGWIGSEIARQVAAFGPERLVLLDHDETHLHDTVYGLQGIAEPEVVLADIRDASVIDAVFRRFRPEIVFHAAAHKHVPILEDYACEAIRTNVFGTLNVVDACARRRRVAPRLHLHRQGGRPHERDGRVEVARRADRARTRRRTTATARCASATCSAAAAA